MAETNEKLALLYNESPNKINRQKIFIEIKNNLKEKTDKIINFWVKRFSDVHEKYDDKMTYWQIADMMILSTLETIQYKSDDFIFEQWYVMILKNALFDYNQKKTKMDNNEIDMDFQDEIRENTVSCNNYEDLSTPIDNKNLYSILEKYIDKLPFKTSGDKNKEYYKNIFLESLGFNEEREPKSYAELAEINNCTRQNIRDCCMRYTKKLVKLLEKENKLEELRQYL